MDEKTPKVDAHRTMALAQRLKAFISDDAKMYDTRPLEALGALGTAIGAVFADCDVDPNQARAVQEHVRNNIEFGLKMVSIMKEGESMSDDAKSSAYSEAFQRTAPATAEITREAIRILDEHGIKQEHVGLVMECVTSNAQLRSRKG